MSSLGRWTVGPSVRGGAAERPVRAFRSGKRLFPRFGPFQGLARRKISLASPQGPHRPTVSATRGRFTREPPPIMGARPPGSLLKESPPPGPVNAHQSTYLESIFAERKNVRIFLKTRYRRYLHPFNSPPRPASGPSCGAQRRPGALTLSGSRPDNPPLLRGMVT